MKDKQINLEGLLRSSELEYKNKLTKCRRLNKHSFGTFEVIR